MKKIYTVLLILIFSVLFVSCENNNNGNNGNTFPEEKFEFTVKVYSLELQPIADFEFVDNNGKTMGKTDINGTFKIIINHSKFFSDVNQPNNRHDKSLNIDFMRPKSENYKYIPYGYYTYEEGTQTLHNNIVYYVDDINSENQLIEENFVIFGGPLVFNFNDEIIDTFVTFKMNDKVIGYSERNEFVKESGYLFRQVFKGSVITIHYETDTKELDYILDENFIKIQENKVTVDQNLNGYRMRLFLKDKIQ